MAPGREPGPRLGNLPGLGHAAAYPPGPARPRRGTRGWAAARVDQRRRDGADPRGDRRAGAVRVYVVRRFCEVGPDTRRTLARGREISDRHRLPPAPADRRRCRWRAARTHASRTGELRRAAVAFARPRAR